MKKLGISSAGLLAVVFAFIFAGSAMAADNGNADAVITVSDLFTVNTDNAAATIFVETGNHNHDPNWVYDSDPGPFVSVHSNRNATVLKAQASAWTNLSGPIGQGDFTLKIKTDSSTFVPLITTGIPNTQQYVAGWANGVWEDYALAYKLTNATSADSPGTYQTTITFTIS